MSPYKVIIHWSVQDRAYLAQAPELAGCMADGITPEEALANLKIVMEEWIEMAREQGRPIPDPDDGPLVA